MSSVHLFLEDWEAVGHFGASAGVLTEILLTDSDPDATRSDVWGPAHTETMGPSL